MAKLFTKFLGILKVESFQFDEKKFIDSETFSLAWLFVPKLSGLVHNMLLSKYTPSAVGHIKSDLAFKKWVFTKKIS